MLDASCASSLSGIVKRRNMSEQTPQQKRTSGLEPRPAFTMFDLLHLLFTVVAALESAVLVGSRFGGLWGLLAFVVVGVGSFFLLGYATAAPVLFLHRRY